MNAISNKEFNDSIDSFLTLLQENLTGFVRGGCRQWGTPQVKLPGETGMRDSTNHSEHRSIFARLYIQEILYIDFTILYDKFYTVPVLYFTVSHEQGEGVGQSTSEEEYAPTSVVQIHSLEALVEQFGTQLGTTAASEAFAAKPETASLAAPTPPTEGPTSAHTAAAAALSSVSLDVNPVTNLVSFFVHPCETKATLSEWEGISDPLSYLTTWFNLYGLPAVFPAVKFRPQAAGFDWKS